MSSGSANRRTTKKPEDTGLRFFRPFLPLFATIFFCLLSVGASLATLPFYVTDELGGGNLAVGFVVATIAVAAIVARPIAGRLADSRGYKPILMTGALACSAAGALYYASLHVAVLVPVRLVHGIGEAAVYTAGAAWLVAICPPARRGRVVGLYGTAMWLGITLGALAGELLRDGIGFRAVWAFCILMPLVGLAFAASTPPPEQGGGAAKPVLVPRGAVVPGIALSLASLGYGALAAFVALHLQHKGISGG
ncbi:MAG TPA: MFS transporter, partial [Mycobacteriales bacterium]|nr:MFS transporter [Mycobacteriales bacterium]